MLEDSFRTRVAAFHHNCGGTYPVENNKCYVDVGFRHPVAKQSAETNLVDVL